MYLLLWLISVATGILVVNDVYYPTYNHLYNHVNYQINGSIARVFTKGCEMEVNRTAATIGVVYEGKMGCSTSTGRINLLHVISQHYKLVITVTVLPHIESLVLASETPWSRKSLGGNLALTLHDIPITGFAEASNEQNPWENIYMHYGTALNVINIIHNLIVIGTVIITYRRGTVNTLQQGMSGVAFTLGCFFIIEHIVYQAVGRGAAIDFTDIFRFLGAGIALVTNLIITDRYLNLCSYILQRRVQKFTHIYLGVTAAYTTMAMFLRIITSYTASGLDIVFWIAVPAAIMWVFVIILQFIIGYSLILQFRGLPARNSTLYQFLIIVLIGMVMGIFILLGIIILAGINTNNPTLVETVRQLFQVSTSVFLLTSITSFYLESNHKISFQDQSTIGL